MHMCSPVRRHGIQQARTAQRHTEKSCSTKRLNGIVLLQHEVPGTSPQTFVDSLERILMCASCDSWQQHRRIYARQVRNLGVCCTASFREFAAQLALQKPLTCRALVSRTWALVRVRRCARTLFRKSTCCFSAASSAI